MRKLGAERLCAGDYEGYVYLFPHENRLNPFLDVETKLSDSEYWRLLADVWTGGEVTYRNRYLWLRLFEKDRPCRDVLFSDEDKAAFAKLPAEFAVHRGYRKRFGKWGLSWTLSKETAIFFATKYFRRSGEGMLLTGHARKEDVLALFTERDEQEIVIRPERVTRTRAMAVGLQELQLAA